MSHLICRRFALQGASSVRAAGIVAAPTARAQATSAPARGAGLTLTQHWDKTFPQSSRVAHRKVTFKNCYGIRLVGNLYQLRGASGKLAAIAACGPFGAVKEQASGLDAHGSSWATASDAGRHWQRKLSADSRLPVPV